MNRENYETVLRRVSDRMMNMKQNGIQEKYPISLLDMEAWEWPQGVGLYGLFRYYKTSKDEDILKFLFLIIRIFKLYKNYQTLFQ